jgi:hypothetical protein
MHMTENYKSLGGKNMDNMTDDKMTDVLTGIVTDTRLSILLSDPSPCLRLMVLRELMGYPDEDPEVQELLLLRELDPLASVLFSRQKEDGSWEADGQIWQGGPLRATTLALMRLGYLGFTSGHAAVQRGADYLFSLQQEDGGWPLLRGFGEEEGYSMIPLQTALPLRALAMCGFGRDPRAEKAYGWLLSRRLEDGAWPTGIAGGSESTGVHGFVGGYRRLAHSRWGCRSNTTGVLLCLAHHPDRRQGREARRALDLLLGRETREVKNVGLEVSRLVGAEPTRGTFTYFARFDPALILDLCRLIGATSSDARVSDLSGMVLGILGESGIWHYEAQPQVSRWVTFDLLRSLSSIRPEGDWMGMEPRTPFQPYALRRKRF